MLGRAAGEGGLLVILVPFSQVPSDLSLLLRAHFKLILIYKVWAETNKQTNKKEPTPLMLCGNLENTITWALRFMEMYLVS